jgi:hypothetical protein
LDLCSAISSRIASTYLRSSAFLDLGSSPIVTNIVRRLSLVVVIVIAISFVAVTPPHLSFESLADNMYSSDRNFRTHKILPNQHIDEFHI